MTVALPYALCVAAALLPLQDARAADQGSPLTTVQLAAVVAAIDRAAAALHRPGLIIGITDREKTQALIVHGYSDIKAKTPLTVDSRVALGSISKSFTAIALMQLADEGRFDPLKPAHDYLPSFAVHSPYRTITGRDLLSMTSGLPNYLANLSSSPFAAIELQHFEPTYAPGEHWWYSNTGFQILGYVLERIEGAPYRTVIQQRLLDPLGMTSSSAAVDDSQRSHMAVSYTRWAPDGQFVEAPWFEYAAGDGSIVSTAPDMCRYLRFILNQGVGPTGRLLSAERFRDLTTTVLKDYAYGLMVHQEDGNTVIAHAGQMAGYENYFEVHLQAGFGVILMSNGGLDEAFRKWVLAAVSAAFRHKNLPAAPPVPDDSKAPDLGLYSGTFQSPTTTMEFSTGGGQLILKQGKDSKPLEVMGVDAFRTRTSDSDREPYFFNRGEDGKVSGVSHGADWLAIRGFPGPPAPAVPPAYAQYVGHYANHGPEGPDVRIFVQNGRLMITPGGIYDAPGSYHVPLEPLSESLFHIATVNYSPERAQFDSITDGHALRVVISGVPLYRMDTP